MGLLKNLKLLVVINSLAKGGAEKLIEVTIPHFKRLGVDVTLLLLSKRRSFDGYVKTVEAAGVRIIDLDASSLYNPSIIFSIKKILKTGGFNVVHVHLFPALYFVSTAYKMLPKASQRLISLVYTEHSNHNNRRNHKLLGLVDRWVYNSFDHLIGITEEVKLKLDTWLGHKIQSSVINNGIDVAHIQSVAPYSREHLSGELGCPEDSRYILMAASFRYPKDQSSLIRSLSYLDANYHILLAGEGPELEVVRKLVGELNLAERVHFLGFRSDVIALMKSVDVNVLSSHYEGLSGVTLESLASGKVFLGSDVNGINDIVPDERYLFQCGNSKELADKIISILSNDRLSQLMIAEGINHAQKYDIDKMVNSYLDLYKKLISHN